jgi:hypothetical protein
MMQNAGDKGPGGHADVDKTILYVYESYQTIIIQNPSM